MHQSIMLHLLSDSYNILLEFVDSIDSEVVLYDDPDWEKFPEVGQAHIAAGAEYTCMCVAVCTNAVRWAVGVASKTKNCEQAAILALCVAMAADEENYEKAWRAVATWADLLA